MSSRIRKNNDHRDKKREPAKYSRMSKKSEQSFVYGIHAVEALLNRRPEQVSCLWLQSGRQGERMNAVIKLATQIGLRVQTTDDSELNDMVGGERHQGIVAEFLGGSLWSEDDLNDLLSNLDHPAFVIVLDGVTDPHNLGACLRSANGAGVDVVIAPKDKATGITPVVRKVACGAAETTPFVQVTNLSRTLKQLQDLGVWVIGLADEEDSVLYDVNLSGPIALVMGNEGKGLRRLTREVCDEICTLPMKGTVTSLNVSVASGVCGYEVLRQRRG